ncbi:MAG: ABC transporter ATP-binding protein [Armatimonadetes bacterium]|nr:ABC transporter ATP-binding protein [Armatimonadota bacterium]
MDRQDMPIVQTVNISKRYGNGVATWALRGVNFSVAAGEFVAIVGASGSGKSTLLNMIGALDRPTSGSVYIDGRCTSKLDENGLAALRGDTLGFIFQFHYLLSEFSVLENALMPLSIRKGGAAREDMEWVKMLLSRVGLYERMHCKPKQLSGGQQQRGAIVRALANRPKLILADEPTGNLDSRNGSLVFDLLRELNSQLGIGFVLVTHDDCLAREARRIVSVEDGRIVADYSVDAVEEEVEVVPVGVSLQPAASEGRPIPSSRIY